MKIIDDREKVQGFQIDEIVLIRKDDNNHKCEKAKIIGPIKRFQYPIEFLENKSIHIYNLDDVFKIKQS